MTPSSLNKRESILASAWAQGSTQSKLQNSNYRRIIRTYHTTHHTTRLEMEGLCRTDAQQQSLHRLEALTWAGARLYPDDKKHPCHKDGNEQVVIQHSCVGASNVRIEREAHSCGVSPIDIGRVQDPTGVSIAMKAMATSDVRPSSSKAQFRISRSSQSKHTCPWNMSQTSRKGRWKHLVTLVHQMKW